VRHEDWRERFEFLRSRLGHSYPAYILHESAAWSPVLRKWVFLPRRMSLEQYTEKGDEKSGANTMILVDEGFTSMESLEVGVKTPERGFSSFKFVPGSQDRVIVALKSEENADEGTQASYITVLTIDGKTLLPETQIPGAYKYEGIEFI
jgi:soluble calcium-activated nucleotidase 1